MKTTSLYARILERCWASAGEDHTTPTFWQESETELEQENPTNHKQAQNNEAIHCIRQNYHLERRLFL
jgi:hypothetical protein